MYFNLIIIHSFMYAFIAVGFRPISNPTGMVLTLAGQHMSRTGSVGPSGATAGPACLDTAILQGSGGDAPDTHAVLTLVMAFTHTLTHTQM